MPVEELVAALSGAGDVGAGLGNIAREAQEATGVVESLSQFTSAANSAMSSLSVTVTALQGLTGVLGEDVDQMVRDIAQTASFANEVVDTLSSLPPGVLSALRTGLSRVGAGLAGSAGAGAGAAALAGGVSVAGAFGGTLALVVAQIRSFDERFRRIEEKDRMLDLGVQALRKQVREDRVVKEQQEIQESERRKRRLAGQFRRWYLNGGAVTSPPSQPPVTDFERFSDDPIMNSLIRGLERRRRSRASRDNGD